MDTSGRFDSLIKLAHHPPVLLRRDEQLHQRFKRLIKYPDSTEPSSPSHSIILPRPQREEDKMLIESRLENIFTPDASQDAIAEAAARGVDGATELMSGDDRRGKRPRFLTLRRTCKDLEKVYDKNRNFLQRLQLHRNTLLGSGELHSDLKRMKESKDERAFAEYRSFLKDCYFAKLCCFTSADLLPNKNFNNTRKKGD